MQLVTHPRCFEGYPLSLLPRALVKQTSKSPFHANLNTTLLRLQCFCEITGADLRSTGKRQLAAALNEFAAALFSKMFLRSDSRPWSVLFALRRALPTGVILQFPSTFNRPKWPKDFRRRVDYYDQLKIDPEKLDFWRGWVFRNAGKRAITLILWRFWKTFGQDRAGELIAAVRTHQSTGHFDSLPVVQFFIDT